jgi:hypothetical protein
MTDSTGLVQHGIYGIPRRESGYTTDDNARALRLCVRLIVSSVIIVAVGAWLIVSPLATTLGFVSLPPLYWLYLAIMLLGYAILTQVVKTWFIRRFGE